MKPKVVLLSVAVVGIALLASTTTALATDAEKVDKNTVKIRRVGKTTVEIEVTSSRSFPVTNALVVLNVGKQQSSLSGYPKNGDLHTLIFTMTTEAFGRAKDGDPISVEYSPDSQTPWTFGPLDKSQIDK